MEKPKASKTKRKATDEPIIIDQNFLKDLAELIGKIEWDYKVNWEDFHKRDKALFAFLVLSGCRISEALRLKRKQFKEYKDHILLVNIETLKHGKMRSKIIIPKTGGLQPITEIFLAWFQKCPSPENIIFPTGSMKGQFNWNKSLSRYRAHRIIKTTINKFPHWARAICATIYARRVFKRDAWKLKEFMGWKSMESSSAYVGGSWEEDENKIKRL